MEELDGGLVLLGLNQAPSMNAVLRALKKEECSLHNCVASIADDARFVQQASWGGGPARTESNPTALVPLL